MRNDIPLIDANAPFENFNGDYKAKFKIFTDRMHLTPEGKKLLAKTLLEPIKKIIQSRNNPVKL